MPNEEKLNALLEGQARLQERSESIIREINSQNKHLALINGHLQRHQDDITAIKTTVYGKNGDDGLCGKVRSNASYIIKLIIITSIISAGVGSGISQLLGG